MQWPEKLRCFWSMRPGVLLTLGLVVPLCAMADSRPLWEWGLGPSVVSFSDYPGSASTHRYTLPLPYIRYRGTFLRADREGLRGMLLDTPRVSLNVSVGASVPVRSRDAAARAGMPDLDALLEAGPVLAVHLWSTRSRRCQLDLRVPARLAFTVSSAPREVGGYLAPQLNLDIRRVGGTPGWSLGLLAGPIYASQRYNQHFYSVAPRYATAARPAYGAAAGYSGSEFIAALSRRFPQFWVGGFVRYMNLEGAVFADSPLLQRRHDLAGGLGLAWILGRSARRVEAEE
jgi:outer membrane scaffolding protein for murein synthesis (MipA/OmpV family)